LKLTVFSVGRERADAAAPLVADYLGRVSKFLPIDDQVLKQDKDDKVAARILDKVGGAGLLVALDETGKMFDSRAFAKLFSSWMDTGVSKVSFVIGGADGLPPEIKKKADLLLSLSPMTLPHRLARLFLVEQIYRALCILRGAPYQK
jgi:23S rRNA (pseudouridine1915-N3)-methyltransferase